MAPQNLHLQDVLFFDESAIMLSGPTYPVYCVYDTGQINLKKIEN